MAVLELIGSEYKKKGKRKRKQKSLSRKLRDKLFLSHLSCLKINLTYNFRKKSLFLATH